jgi:hypothetical protein
MRVIHATRGGAGELHPKVVSDRGTLVVVADCFVIMQIGDPALDVIYREAIVPAVAACGLVPKRIDTDNEGGLLNAEIMASIENADIIVADLTNERPNCYLEVGYALGLGRQRNLVLTVRRDHLPGDENHVVGGPKVHFDLAGYDLLMWEPDNVEALRVELERRIHRRLAIIEGTRPSQTGAETVSPWYSEQRSSALDKIKEQVGPGFLELRFELAPPKIERPPADLLEAARNATISTFGWPIGIVVNRDGVRPYPTGTGVRAEVSFARSPDESSYDYWELLTNGDFLTVQSLFEDQRGWPTGMFFDTRIQRITECFLYCGRLYDRLGVNPDHTISFTIRHGGLNGRILTAATPGRSLSSEPECKVDESSTTVNFRLTDIDVELIDLVMQVAEPLFQLFDFQSIGREDYEQIVDRFVQGKI